MPSLAVATIVADDVRRRRIVSVLERGGLSNGSAAPHLEAITDDAVLDAVVLGTEELDDALQQMIDVIKTRLPTTAVVVVVAGSSKSKALRAALDRGADGIVIDSDLETVLPLTVRLVVAGHLVLPQHYRDIAETPTFSAREKQILSMVVLGFRNGEIARRLFLSESTVKTHLSTAFRKLGVRSRKEAAAAILDPESGLGNGILGISEVTDPAPRSLHHERLPRATLLESKLRMPSHVVRRSFIRETVILDVRSGTYHKINATGGRMLDMLDRAPSLRAAAAQIAAEYERPLAEIEADVCEFSKDLLRRGLIDLGR